MSKLKRVKRLEPVFEYEAGDSKVLVYTFDTDYANYFVVTCVKDGPHDEEIYACGTYTDARKLIEEASYKDGKSNAFKTLLNDEKAVQRLQETLDYVVEGEWW
jgi:hypothetical protein